MANKLMNGVLLCILALGTLFLLSMLPVTHALSGSGPSNPASALDTGTIEGVVRFPDEYPERQKIIITKDQAICGAFQYADDFTISEETRGLKNVVISLVNPPESTLPEAGQAQLDQMKCQYVPHVQAVVVGTSLDILNNDGILHNVHAYLDDLKPKNTVFNKAQPKFLKKISQELDQAGLYYFKCDVHSHMSAFIAVMKHRFYSVTGDDGEFTISNVPVGSYKIRAWHEVLGTMEKTVEVKAGEAASVTFDILPNE